MDQTSGGTLATPPAPNVAPDIIVKLANDRKLAISTSTSKSRAWSSEFKLAHSRLDYRVGDRSTRVKAGGGGSINMNLELFKNFRLIENAFYSDGGGRYIFGLGPDLGVITSNDDFAIYARASCTRLRELGVSSGRPRKSSMWYAYYGGAYYGRDATIDPSSSTGALGRLWIYEVVFVR